MAYPPYVILATEQAVEYFRDHTEQFIEVESFLVEVLHYLIEAMEDWSEFDKNIGHSIEYELYEHGVGDAGLPDEFVVVRDCLWKLARAIEEQVERHRLVDMYHGFQYKFYQVAGNCVVLVRSDLKPRGGTNYLRSYT